MKIEFAAYLDFAPGTSWHVIVDGLRVNKIEGIFTQEYVEQRARKMGENRKAHHVVIERW